jgi:hypothetical protein
MAVDVALLGNPQNADQHVLGTPRSTLESKIRTLKINKSRFRTRAPKRS